MAPMVRVLANVPSDSTDNCALAHKMPGEMLWLDQNPQVMALTSPCLNSILVVGPPSLNNPWHGVEMKLFGVSAAAR